MSLDNGGKRLQIYFLNMNHVLIDSQRTPLNSILLFILNILPAEYSDEYPAGWYLVPPDIGHVKYHA